MTFEKTEGVTEPRNHGGRPRVMEKLQVVGFRMLPAEKARIKESASAMNVTISEYLRYLMGLLPATTVSDIATIKNTVTAADRKISAIGTFMHDVENLCLCDEQIESEQAIPAIRGAVIAMKKECDKAARKINL